MSERNELRVFHTREEMQQDYEAFCKNEADQYHQRDMTARAGSWLVRWVHGSRAGGPDSMIAGMCFNRIRCDLRCEERVMLFCMSRLRSPNQPVEPMQVFYKKIW